MITFSRATYDEIIAHAREGAPEEICGVLAGDHGDEESTVAAAHPTENVADRPRTRYYIDPEEQFEVIEAIEEAGREVAGFYHSHPAGPTLPSETDADRATWPGLSYVIVALDGEPYVGAWRWDDEDGTFRQETVRIE